MTLSDKHIAFIGSGNITEILIDNLVGTQAVKPENIIVTDKDKTKRKILRYKYDVKRNIENLEAVSRSDIIFLNVRPQDLNKLLLELRNADFTNKLIISVIGGAPIKKVESLGENLAVVRALPNPPSQYGHGIIGLCFNDNVSDDQRNITKELFSNMGEYIVLKEELMNAKTSLSAPAPVYMFIDAMIEAGVSQGFDRINAEKIVYRTITGALEILKQEDDISYIIKQSCTPGGISEEIVRILNKNNFRETINEAVSSGTHRAKSLGG